jgi:hypothetical protein
MRERDAAREDLLTKDMYEQTRHLGKSSKRFRISDSSLGLFRQILFVNMYVEMLVQLLKLVLPKPLLFLQPTEKKKRNPPKRKRKKVC